MILKIKLIDIKFLIAVLTSIFLITYCTPQEPCTGFYTVDYSPISEQTWRLTINNLSSKSITVFWYLVDSPNCSTNYGVFYLNPYESAIDYISFYNSESYFNAGTITTNCFQEKEEDFF